MTKKERYSHSKISTFEQCPLKYRLRYIDKIKIKQKSIEGFLGSMIHETLEWLYRQVKKEKTPKMDEVIFYYASNWEKNFEPEKYFIVREGLTVKDYLEKGLKFLLDYYQTNYPFEDNTIAIEKIVSILLDDSEEYEFMGIIDRLVYNPETEYYEIHDYKTANNLPDSDKVENDRQLPLYSIAVKDDFNTNKIKLIWHYLAHNKKIHSKRTDEQIIKLKEETINLIKKIEDTKIFPYNKSILCNWCEYRKICPAKNNN